MTEIYFLCAAIALLVAGAALGVWRFRRTARGRLAEAPTFTLQQMEAMNRRISLLEAELETVRREHSAQLRRYRHDLAGCLNIASGFRELLELEAASLSTAQRNYLSQMGEGLRRAFEVTEQLGPERRQETAVPGGTEVPCE